MCKIENETGRLNEVYVCELCFFFVCFLEERRYMIEVVSTHFFFFFGIFYVSFERKTQTPNLKKSPMIFNFVKTKAYEPP